MGALSTTPEQAVVDHGTNSQQPNQDRRDLWDGQAARLHFPQLVRVEFRSNGGCDGDSSAKGAHGFLLNIKISITNNLAQLIKNA